MNDKVIIAIISADATITIAAIKCYESCHHDDAGNAGATSK